MLKGESLFCEQISNLSREHRKKACDKIKYKTSFKGLRTGCEGRGEKEEQRDKMRNKMNRRRSRGENGLKGGGVKVRREGERAGDRKGEDSTRVRTDN